MDTHAASVFLDGARALKIKRAVRFPYLDYSTLEKRKAACDEEMKVNRKFAPRIYPRVVPITQSAQGPLEIDRDGTPVDSPIQMAPFTTTHPLTPLPPPPPPHPTPLHP